MSDIQCPVPFYHSAPERMAANGMEYSLDNYTTKEEVAEWRRLIDVHYRQLKWESALPPDIKAEVTRIKHTMPREWPDWATASHEVPA